MATAQNAWIMTVERTEQDVAVANASNKTKYVRNDCTKKKLIGLRPRRLGD